MNYHDPELRERLAAEYVVGTLRGRARERFERLLLEQPAMQSALERWERYLAPLALAAPARQPRRRVWRRIERRIGGSRRRPMPLLWPLTTAAASAAAALLAAYIVVTPPTLQPREPAFVAALGAPEEGPRWTVVAGAQRLSIETQRPADLPADQDLELWLLPGDDRAPISLGLVPETGRVERELGQQVLAAVSGAAGTAISREPRGGSPTGAPTGPILYQGELIVIEE